MSTPSALSVAIVGSGPGGLTLARILQRNGINPRVFERETVMNERSQGGSLDLHHESGLQALKDAGLMEEFLVHARFEGDTVRIQDKTGTVLFQHSKAISQNPDVKPEDDPHARPEIDRYSCSLAADELLTYVPLGKTYAPSSSILFQKIPFSGVGGLKV